MKVENDKVFIELIPRQDPDFNEHENCEILTIPITCDRLTPEEAARDPRQQINTEDFGVKIKKHLNQAGLDHFF